MNNDDQAPKFWIGFLRWFAPADLVEGVEGDLVEQFRSDVVDYGRRTAVRRFIFNVISFFRPGILLRNKFALTTIQYSMLKNYLKVAWRNMSGNRTHTAINLTGLTVGLSISIVLFWIVRFEFNFDRYHANSDRIYQIISKDKFGERNSHVPQGVIYTLRSDFPEVESAVTVYGQVPQVIRVGDRNLKGENTAFVHPEFMAMIDLKWVSGSPAQSLRPNQVVIDQPTALKFFGDENPLGRVIRYDNVLDVQVSGIIEKMPLNSEFRFPMIMSYETLVNIPGMNNFRNQDYWGGGDSWCHGFVLLTGQADKAAIERRLAAIAEQRKDIPKYVSFELVPLTHAHFDPNNDSFNYSIPRWMLRALMAIAVFIILIVVINFVNLSTAQAAQRGREIGLRKVLGGSRRSTIFQFFTETGVMVFLSIFLASLLATRLIGYSGEFFNTRVHETQVWDTNMFFYLLLLFAVITLLAGAYPALLLSGLKPVRIFQKQVFLVSGRSVSLRKSLVVIQFVIAQVMLICMVIGKEQMQFFYQTDLGFEKAGIVTVNMPHRDSVLLRERFRNQLLQHPEIKSVTFGLTAPSGNRNWWWGDTHHPRLQGGEQTFRLQWIDDKYLDFYEITILAGRNFLPTDTSSVALINEQAIRALGLSDPEEALGEKLYYWGRNETTVIGVVKDYYSQGLKAEVPPHLLMNGDWNFQLAQIKIDPARSSAAIDLIHKYWQASHPENYFEYGFLSDELSNFYEDERKFSNFIFLFSVVGIFIGCLGLFGLVSFVCVRRSHEVSIRKVMGASLGHIVSLLSQEFVVMVSIAFLIAAPLGWYIMDSFLSRYTYHIDINWLVFLAAGGCTLCLALLTVVARSFATANENPIQRLRSE